MKKITIKNQKTNETKTFRIGVEFFAKGYNFLWINKCVNKIEKKIFYTIVFLFSFLSIFVLFIFVGQFVFYEEKLVDGELKDVYYNWYVVIQYVFVGIFSFTMLSWVILDWFFLGKFYLKRRLNNGWESNDEHSYKNLVEIGLIKDQKVLDEINKIKKEEQDKLKI